MSENSSFFSTFAPKRERMAHFGQSDDYRREELIRIIEHSIQRLTLQELESLYYDMTTKQFIADER